MILKIQSNHREPHSEKPEVIVECDRYDKRTYNSHDNKAEAESMFCGENGEVDPTVTLTTFKKGKFANLFILGYATVFVMNDEGKTVEVIYT